MGDAPRTHLGFGLTLGIAGALLAATVLRGVLVRIRPTDVPTLLSVAVLLVIVTAVASFLPAQRAARTDPLQVLRSE